MFLLIVVIVLALLVGCRQQCLPPRLCYSGAGVAFFFSSACCSPPSFLSGRSATVLASLSSLSSSGCVLSLSCACRSRLASCRRALGQVRPSSPLSAFVLPLLSCSPRVFAVRRQLAHTPVFGAESSPPQKPPYRSAPPWAVCSPSPSLLVSWVGGLPPVGLVLPPPAGAGRTIVYISYPHLYGSCGGMFHPIPLPNTI